MNAATEVAVPRKALTEVNTHVFATEASTVGLRPGMVPSRITVNEQFGNGMGFYLFHADADVFKYRQLSGCVEVHILND